MTVPVTATVFLRGQLAHFVERGWEVRLLCGERGLDEFARAEGVTEVHVVPASREPSLRDLVTLAAIFWTLLKVRPDVVVMGTPKVGVLGSIAASAARVPTRIYLVHGYRAEGMSGMKRRVMRELERVACAAATEVVAVSASLMEKLIQEGVVAPDKVFVLGHGSANGVDLDRFHIPTVAGVHEARMQLGLPSRSQVVACVGRLTKDKGLQHLPAIWRNISAEFPAAWLILAGERECVDDQDELAIDELRALPRVRMIGHTDAVEGVYSASDVLLLLSKREGLGMVALEAAACGVPTVGFAVTGVMDAVADQRTGLLFTDGDTDGVGKALAQLLADASERRSMGHAGARRVAEAFRREIVWSNWDRLLDKQVEVTSKRIGVRQ